MDIPVPTLAQALCPMLARETGRTTCLFVGQVSETYSIGAVPHGGYTLGIVLSAAIASQINTKHPDVLHISAHFLRPATGSRYEVNVSRIREGKGLSNVDADLIQEGVTKITARLVFGVLPDLSERSLAMSHPLTLHPSSTLARRIPLRTHPSDAAVSPMHPKFRIPVRIAEDPYYNARNAVRASSNSLEEDGGGTGLEWAAWCELTGDGMTKDEQLTEAMVPFFADLLRNMPELLPEDIKTGANWYPTITMSIEFKAKIPTQSAQYAPRTIGLYSSGRFLVEGRHDAYCEVWTAPSGIKSASATSPASSAWRDGQICLAVSHQMALTIPLEVNLRKRASRL